MILTQSGKAAFNVGGTTIQSSLSIPLSTKKFVEINGETKAYKIKELDQIEYICIDEISLVSKSLFS